MILEKNLTAIAIVTFFALAGCDDAKYDSSNSDSLARMTRGMSEEEVFQFLHDFQLIKYLHDGRAGTYGDGSYVLNGLTVEDIRKEARLAPEYIKEKNSKFISQVLFVMDSESLDVACIYQNKFGFLMPARNDIRPQDRCRNYSRAELSTILEDNNIIDQKSGVGLNFPKKISEDVSNKKIPGDAVNNNIKAEPLYENEINKKEKNKRWQDENGFMHYPDGSVSASPVD